MYLILQTRSHFLLQNVFLKRFSSFFLTVIHCPSPNQPLNGFVYSPCTTHYGSQCSLACYTGYFANHTTISCNEKGFWEPSNISCNGKYLKLDELLKVLPYITERGLDIQFIRSITLFTIFTTLKKSSLHALRSMFSL